MYGFVGFCDLNNNISAPKNTEILKVLSNNFSPSQEDFYGSIHINLGYRKTIYMNPPKSKHPMICKYEDNTYIIAYNGQLYNAKEIRNELINFGYEFNRSH